MKRLLLSAVVLFAVAGCANPCIKLAEKICECSPSTTAKDACIKAANDELANVNVTSSDEATCDSLIDKCDCSKLNDADGSGKVNCGLARKAPSSP